MYVEDVVTSRVLPAEDVEDGKRTYQGYHGDSCLGPYCL